MEPHFDIYMYKKLICSFLYINFGNVAITSEQKQQSYDNTQHMHQP